MGNDHPALGTAEGLFECLSFSSVRKFKHTNMAGIVQTIQNLAVVPRPRDALEALTTTAVSRREFEVSDRIRLTPHPCRLEQYMMHSDDAHILMT